VLLGGSNSTHYVPADPGVVELLAQYEGPVLEAQRTDVGRTTVDLQGDPLVVRRQGEPPPASFPCGGHLAISRMRSGRSAAAERSRSHRRLADGVGRHVMLAETNLGDMAADASMAFVLSKASNLEVSAAR
jgi:hypothetical protein